MLVQDDVGGLEVEDPHSPGTFVVKHLFFTIDSSHFSQPPKPVPPIPGSIVVNAGDFLMMCSYLIVSPNKIFEIVLIGSNNTIRSTIHRVRSPTTKGDIIPSRYSIPYVRAIVF